jgi:hypothetical protein
MKDSMQFVRPLQLDRQYVRAIVRSQHFGCVFVQDPMHVFDRTPWRRAMALLVSPLTASAMMAYAAVELRACELRQEQRRGDIRWRIAGPILDGTSDRIDDVIEIFVPGAGPGNITPELQALKRTRSAGQFNALPRLEVSILPVEKRPGVALGLVSIGRLADGGSDGRSCNWQSDRSLSVAGGRSGDRG